MVGLAFGNVRNGSRKRGQRVRVYSHLRSRLTYAIEGFDEVGATQLKHKLIGTMKWIGTAELYTAYTYRGIP
jgi:hypothetical protein